MNRAEESSVVAAMAELSIWTAWHFRKKNNSIKQTIQPIIWQMESEYYSLYLGKSENCVSWAWSLLCGTVVSKMFGVPRQNFFGHLHSCCKCASRFTFSCNWFISRHVLQRAFSIWHVLNLLLLWEWNGFLNVTCSQFAQSRSTLDRPYSQNDV